MKARILIAEDEGLIALDLKRKLEQIGYSITAIADNAADVLLNIESAEESQRPDLILMDIRLHGPEDGITTADQIRKRYQLPVMFVTAHADRETLDRAKITEPFGYIVKPFHGVDFGAQIEMALWKHKMEQQLRFSEAWLAATIRNVADGLIATDSQGNIVFMNSPAAKLTGWDCLEVPGLPLLEVFQVFEEATDLPVLNPLEAINSGRELGSQRTFKLVKRGVPDSVPDWIVVEASFSANRDDGRLLGVVVIFRDVTSQRKAEAQSRQLQKMNSLSLMSVGLGRELADAQNRMDHSLQELIAISTDPYLPLLKDIYRGVARQQLVVQKLIKLGNNDPGHPVLLDLNEVLRELETRFRKLLGVSRTLRMNLQSGLPFINADPDELRESLCGLLAEERAATERGDLVEVTTSTVQFAENREGVQLALRDTGKRIRAMSTERVFDPYYQSRAGTRNPGLSLALVYHFIALNDGRVEVDGSPEQGSVYKLSFPAANNSQQPPAGTARLTVASA